MNILQIFSGKNTPGVYILFVTFLTVFFQKAALNSTILDPNCTRFARCHFRTQKSLNFQGPPLPMALEMDFSPSKSLRPAPYKQKEH